MDINGPFDLNWHKTYYRQLLKFKMTWTMWSDWVENICERDQCSINSSDACPANCVAVRERFLYPKLTRLTNSTGLKILG